MSEMTSGEFFARTIKGYGLTHIFLVPAVFRQAMVAMEELGIRRVTAHHEVAAAYMADGYARASRGPAVCFAQAVGNANLAAGLRESFLAGSAVVAITGGGQAHFRYKHLYQVTEDFPMFEPLTKFNARVEMPGRLPDLLRQAFRVATTGAPGPVHLEIPGRLGEIAQGAIDTEVLVEEPFTRVPAYRQGADPSQVEAALAALAAAERPVLVVGGGVTVSNASEEFVKLAELLQIPVAVSLNGKENIPEDHPLNIGLIGTYGRWTANALVADADLVFFVGSEAGGHVTDLFKVPRPGTKVLQLDIDPQEAGRNYHLEAAVVGDAKVALKQMIEAASPTAPRTAWLERARESVRQWRSSIEETYNSDASPVHPARAVRELSDVLPDNAVLVADTGHSAIWTGTMFRLKKGQRYIRCAGTLGWAFPATLGIKCALPDRPVVAFVGDGGFYYHMAEMETMARIGINAIVVVNNNGRLRQERAGLTAAYGGTRGPRAHEMWEFKQPDFAGIAERMGCVGIRVEKASEMRPALEKALGANAPVIIDLIGDPEPAPQGPWDRSSE